MGEGTNQFKALVGFMPEGWEAQAKALGALQRSREIKTPEDLLLLIFLYLTEGKSFGGTSAIVKTEGEWHLTKKAVWSRICNSGEWLKWLYETLCRKQGILVEKPGWLFGKNVWLVDGNEAVLCGRRKKYYMLHYGVDLFTLAMKEMRLTDIKSGEKLLNFRTFGKSDIVVGDRAYGTIPGREHLRERESGFVLRLRARAFNLYDGQKKKIDLIESLSGLKEGESRSIAVNYQVNGEYVPLRICALRKDADSERAGLKRLRKSKQRKQHGKAVSALESEYNKYIIVATCLGEEIAASRVLELYRMRWEIELIFKRLKSLFHYGEVPMKQDKSARAWFYGKLLLAAFCETLVNTGRFSPGKHKNSESNQERVYL
jgi:hypothetical protein